MDDSRVLTSSVGKSLGGVQWGLRTQHGRTEIFPSGNRAGASEVVRLQLAAADPLLGLKSKVDNLVDNRMTLG